MNPMHLNTTMPGEKCTGMIDFEIWVDDEITAQTSGPRDMALAEARRYALEYAVDGGRVEIIEVTRTVIETLEGVSGVGSPE